MSADASSHSNPSSGEIVRDCKPKPTLRQTAMQVLLSVAMLGLTGAIVTYSAMVSFPRAQSIAKHRSFESSDASQWSIYGKVGFVANNVTVEDSGAAVLLWPVAKPSAKFELTESELFVGSPDPQRPLLIAITAIDGEYAVPRVRLASDADATSEYFALAISANSHRSAPILSGDEETLSRYFAEPKALLGDRRYQLARISLSNEESIEQGFQFGADGLASISTNSSANGEASLPNTLPAAAPNE